jgi:hypothetical protein
VIIEIRQSGGFAGGDPVRIGQVDTAMLPAAEQARAEQLAALIHDPPDGTMPIGADLPEYHVELRSGDGPARTIVVPDDMDPDNPLLRSLRELLELVART